MSIPLRHSGGVQSSAAAASYTDFDGATMDYDSGGAYAQITANRCGGSSAGLKLRTMLAGVVLTVVTFAAAGTAAFGYAVSAPGVTSSAGLTVSSGTSALQAITGTSLILTAGATVTSASAGSATATFNGVYSALGTVDLSIWNRNTNAVSMRLRYDDAATGMRFGTSSAHSWVLERGGVTQATVGSLTWAFNSVAVSGITTMSVADTITLSADGTLPAGTVTYIGRASGAINANVASGNAHTWRVNGASVMSLTSAQHLVTVDTVVAGELYTGGSGASNQGRMYTVANTLNFDWGIDSDRTVAINATGYNAGTTRYRTLWVQDGKGATIATFDGPTKLVTLANGLTVSSGTTALQAATATTLDTTSAVTIVNNGNSLFLKSSTSGNQSSVIRWNKSDGTARFYLGFEAANTDFYLENAAGGAMNFVSANSYVFDNAVSASMAVASVYAGSLTNTSSTGLGLFVKGGGGASGKYPFRVQNYTGSDLDLMAAAGTRTWAAYGAGAATFDASGNITSVSDERHKTRIRRWTRGMKDLRGVETIIHGFNERSGLDMKFDYIGFSAQNLRKHIPETVFEKNGVLSMWDRGVLATHTNALQELDERILKLEKVS